MHNVRSRPASQWVSGAVPNARDLKHWDDAQYHGLDGVNGGTYSPTTPIGIGGAGVQLSGECVLYGGFETQLGGRYVLGGGTGDYPVFSAGDRTRTVVFPLRGAGSTTGTLYRVNANVNGRPVIRQGWFDPKSAAVYLPIPQRWVMDGSESGATLTSVSLQALLANHQLVGGTLFQATLFDATNGTSYTPSTQWQASTVYSLGALVIPSGAAYQTGFWYKATTGGTSASSAPTWPTTIGNTVTDGSVVWTCEGYAGTIPRADYVISPYTAPITLQLTPSSTLVPNVSHGYILVVNQDQVNNQWVYTSCTLTYENIANMAFQ
jgi:hypothetical protein